MPLNDENYSNDRELTQAVSYELSKFGRSPSLLDRARALNTVRARSSSLPIPAATAAPSLSERLKATIEAERAEAREISAMFADLTADVANDDVILSPAELEDLRTLDDVLNVEDEPEEAPAAPATVVRKKSKLKRRGDKAADLKFARATRVRGTARPTSRRGKDSRAVRRHNTPSRAPFPSLYTKDDKRPPLWRDTKDTGKITWMNRVIYAGGNALTWTLNLSPEIEKRAANDNGATWLAGRIGYRLEKEFGKTRAKEIMGELFFVIGAAKGRRLHLHGVAAVTDNERPAFERALDQAGGHWRGTSGTSVETEREWSPDGWSRYVFEHIPQAERLIAGNPVYAPNNLRSRAKELYTRERARLIG